MFPTVHVVFPPQTGLWQRICNAKRFCTMEINTSKKKVPL